MSFPFLVKRSACWDWSLAVTQTTMVLLCACKQNGHEDAQSLIKLSTKLTLLYITRILTELPYTTSDHRGRQAVQQYSLLTSAACSHCIDWTDWWCWWWKRVVLLFQPSFKKTKIALFEHAIHSWAGLHWPDWIRNKWHTQMSELC